MTNIVVVYRDRVSVELNSDMDYESIVHWCRERVEYNDNIDQIIVEFNEGRMIFEAIN